MSASELLNTVQQLRAGHGVSAVRQYLQALYEETKERLVDSTEENGHILKAEARLLKRLYQDFGKTPDDTPPQRDGAYS